MKQYALLAILVATILLVACGGNARTIDEPATDPATVEEALIDARELSNGWQFKDEIEPDGPQATFCGHPQTAADFTHGRLFAREKSGLLTEAITAYPGDDDAREAMDEIAEPNQDCVPVLLGDLARDIDFGPLEFPRLADDTFAMTNNGILDLNLIYVRKDNLLVELLIDSDDMEEVEEIARLAVDKLP